MSKELGNELLRNIANYGGRPAVALAAITTPIIIEAAYAVPSAVAASQIPVGKFIPMGSAMCVGESDMYVRDFAKTKADAGVFDQFDPKLETDAAKVSNAVVEYASRDYTKKDENGNFLPGHPVNVLDGEGKRVTSQDPNARDSYWTDEKQGETKTKIKAPCNFQLEDGQKAQLVEVHIVTPDKREVVDRLVIHNNPKNPDIFTTHVVVGGSGLRPGASASAAPKPAASASEKPQASATASVDLNKLTGQLADDQQKIGSLTAERDKVQDQAKALQAQLDAAKDQDPKERKWEIAGVAAAIAAGLTFGILAFRRRNRIIVNEDGSATNDYRLRAAATQPAPTITPANGGTVTVRRG